MLPIFTKFCLASGKDIGPTPLNAMDFAYLNAGVGDKNLMIVSSVLPIGCKLVEPEPLDPDGGLLYIAAARKKREGNEFLGRVFMTAAVAVGVPADPNESGLIMEHSGYFNAPKDGENKVKQMVMDGMVKRKRAIKTILSISATQEITAITGPSAVFACCVLIP